MKKKHFRVSSYALICRENQILLCRISKQLPRWEGFWTLPGGGINFGESPEEALIREVNEETGLIVKPCGIVSIDNIIDNSEDRVFHGIRIIYKAEITGGKLRNEESGTTDNCEWHTLPPASDVQLVDLAKTGIDEAKKLWTTVKSVKSAQISLSTSRLNLKSTSPDHLNLYRNYLLENRSFLDDWEPFRDDNYYTPDNVLKQLEKQSKLMNKKAGYSFFLFLKNGAVHSNNDETIEDKIIGLVNISNIVYGPFRSCFLGFKLSEANINKGYMTEALKAIIDFAFDTLKLHRIEANIMPVNIRSRRVVEKSGFQLEGFSPDYLRINGKWEDHHHFVLINNNLLLEDNE